MKTKLTLLGIFILCSFVSTCSFSSRGKNSFAKASVTCNDLAKPNDQLRSQGWHLFNDYCKTCHFLSRESLAARPLMELFSKYSEEMFLEFIASRERVLYLDDSTWVKHPNYSSSRFKLSEQELKSIYFYLCTYYDPIYLKQEQR